MPTGYTAAVQDGATFKEFALKCARAFGAVVMQKDDSSDAPLKIEYEPSPYHQEQLQQVLQNKLALTNLSEAQWIALLDAQHEAEVQRIEKAKQREAEIELKYKKVLSQARAWVPPTREHQGIKDFMIQQLKDSIEFDCRTYKDKPAVQKSSLFDFKVSKYKSIEWAISYHTEEIKKEIKRAQERTAWLKDFVNSLI